MYVQQVIQTLNGFWQDKGCILWQPYHTEVGAGTSNPATFLRALGPEPWWVAYPEPSTRPADGRYGENPNRLQHYYQYQVILKPSPPNVQELFLQSFEALGLDLSRHDFRFVEDNWQSPSLGAWGLGWEAWLDGMEVLQFTYFQECGGLKLDVRACELTYGIERIAMYLQGVESVYDLAWAPGGITYGDIFHAQEVEYCKYNFEAADTAKLFEVFDLWEGEAGRLLDLGLVQPAYDHCLRLSHAFNLLDARGALSVTERGRFLLRCRAVSERCAKAFYAQREAMGFPLRRLGTPGAPETAAPLPTPDPAELAPQDTLLLEIGVEELPHRDVQAVLQQTPTLVEKLLDDLELAHGAVKAYASPRRIAVEVEGLAARQPDVTREARGPQRKAAVTDAGEWTVAAQKFAEANGAAVGEIYFQKQGKAEYCFVKVERKGLPLTELLPTLVDRLLRGLQFGKSMGWEDTTATFSRPVRWLLALHGSRALPVSWTLRAEDALGPERALHSGRVTYGHRRLRPGATVVQQATAYRDTLRDQLVIVDRDERMAALRQRVQAEADRLGLVVEEDPDLFDEVCDLSEWPEPVVCEIPDEALSLPEAIIITPMKVHQRYIPLRDKDGALSKHFLAVANGEHDNEGRQIIKTGNERVLNARLRDARYFWDTDIKTPLAAFAERLTNVMFHQDLGTVADKVARIRRLYAALANALPPVDRDAIEQVIGLMKADLTTSMVFEFDSLEGAVGMLYAKEQGVPTEIADAILEHRLPRRAGDAMPQGDLGRAAGILDRLDTLAGYFGIGVPVKGTSDPFGLRRNALALIALIETAGIDVDLDDLCMAALRNYGDLVKEPDAACERLVGFLSDRLAVSARDRGYSHDYVAAALAVHARRPRAFYGCLRALAEVNDRQVQDLAEQAKRMERIAKDPADAVDPALLSPDERALHELSDGPAQRVREHVDARAFDKALTEVMAWAPVINAYFEDVLVNDKDDAIRRNRHALIREVLDAVRLPADFTRIEKRDTGD